MSHVLKTLKNEATLELHPEREPLNWSEFREEIRPSFQDIGIFKGIDLTSGKKRNDVVIHLTNYNFSSIIIA